MSLEAFTAYVQTRGFNVREEFVPEFDYQEDDGTITHYEGGLHRMVYKSDGEVAAWGDVHDAMLAYSDGERVWALLLDLIDEEFARQRERLLSAAPG